MRKWAVISLANLGDQKSVHHIIQLLLENDHAKDVLENIHRIHKDVMTEIVHRIAHLSYSEKHFIQHKIRNMKNSEEIAHLLHLKHKSYHEFSRYRHVEMSARKYHRI